MGSIHVIVLLIRGLFLDQAELAAVLSAKTFCTFVRELSSLGLQEDRARTRCGRRQRAGDGRNRIFGPD